MALINTSVPNLIQGVSQQPDATRFAGQCEEQENALSSVADGLKKRPNTRHVGKLLDEAIGEESFVHFIDRSDSEKYVVIHDGTHLYAFNTLSGEEASIQVGTNIYKKSFTATQLSAHNNASPANTTTYVDTGYPVSSTYLDSITPLDVLKALTIADTTFLLNTTKTVSRKQDANGAIERTPELSKKALIFIKQGDYGKQYGITVNAAEASDSTLTLPTITPILTRYTQGSFTHLSGSSRTRGSRYSHTHPTSYGWRLTGLNITGGSGITGNLKLNITSNAAIISEPTVEFTIDANKDITGYNITGQGDFEGLGSAGGGFQMGGGNHAVHSLGLNEPNVSITVTEENGFNTTPVTAVITSGSSGATATDSDTILSNLKTTATNGIDAKFGTAFNIKKSKNLIEMEQTAGEDYRITGFDGLADTGIGVVYREVASISDLPLTAPDGFVVKVRGDSELNSDDYYVKFETEVGVTSTADNITSKVGKGVWVETVAPDIELGAEPETLPKVLKSTGFNTFELKSMDVAQRISGDDYTNPLPSFVGSRINNLTFYKDRLLLLSADSVIMTEAGLGENNEDGTAEYNFNRTTVTTLLDSDPIDVATTSNKVTNFQYAIGFQENLILFSDNQQFVLKGGDLLTPKTVSITPITSFDLDTQVSPLPLGSYVYFPFNRGNFTGVREFTVNSTTDTYDSVEITEHVPAYIPSDIVDMTGTSSEDMLVLLSHSEKNALYVYNYFWNNNQKVLSAWSKFTFTGEIRGIQFNESVLNILMVMGEGSTGETNLVQLPLESGLSDEAGFVTHLDMRCYKTVAQGDNSITLPYTPADNSIEVYTKDGLKLNATNAGATVTLTSPMATSPNLDVTAMVAGRKYTIVSVGTTDFTTLGLPEVNENALVTGQTYQIVTEGTDFTTAGASANTVGTVFTAGASPSTGSTGRAIDISVGTSFIATGALTGTGVVSEPNVWVGIPYTMKYTFSEQLFKAKAGNGTSPSNAAKLLIRNASIYFDETAFFKVKVTPKFRDTYENIFTPDVVGSTTIGTLNLDSGFYRFPVLTKAQDTTITIENGSALPSNFQSAEFESFVHSRSNRYG